MRLVMQSNALKPFNKNLLGIIRCQIQKKKMKTMFHFYSYILNKMQTNPTLMRNTFFHHLTR